MSQVIVRTQQVTDTKVQPVTLIAGWDPPLKEFFLSVLTPDDDVIWLSITAPDKTDHFGVERLVLQLKRLGIDDIPDTFWTVVAQSGAKNEGNVFYQFDKTQGRWELKS